MSRPYIYLDAQASTPIAPEALAAVVAQLSDPGNPHSPHAAGGRAHAAIEDARLAVADLIGAAPSEIVFTSGATEANNLAIVGVARAAASASDRRTILTSAIEHPSVLEAAASLAREGFEHRIAPVDRDGRLDLNAVAGLLDESVLLLSVMAANNVIGTLQPVEEVAAMARRVGAMVHCDAAQAGGRVALDIVDMDVDLLSLSAHKMHGPPGVGALFVSATAAVRPWPVLFGGGQEQGLRSGTQPAGLIAGFGVAARLAAANMAVDATRLRHLAERFIGLLEQHQVRFQTFGSDEHRLPGSLNLALLDCDAQEIVERTSSQIAISTGAACSSGQIRTSPVLDALNISSSLKQASIRLCFNRYSEDDDGPAAAQAIATAVRMHRVATGRAVQ